MKSQLKKGFTLMEAVVVLAILAVIAAIAIPTASHYIKLAEFRKNEANAKTAYLAAESVLTWYRTSGEWEDFRAKIIEKGTPNTTFVGDDADAKNSRIYGVMLNSGKADRASKSEDQVLTLLDESSYDKEFLKGVIAIEVDIETGQVYSAFYATRCHELSYEAEDSSKGVLDISAREGNRSYDNRKGKFLGYYSAEDVTNVVDLKPTQLKVTSINLVNSETLSLNWSSNSRYDNRDVNFTITFYNDETKEELFSTQVNRTELRKNYGWSGAGAVRLNLKGPKTSGGEQADLGDWYFPLAYEKGGVGQNGRFSLTLDGMMSAALIEGLKANEGGSGGVTLARTTSTSITRLAVNPGLEELKSPQDIYAVIKADPYYKGIEEEKDFREYQESRPVTSNVENTLFAKGSKEKDAKLEAGIARFRHLSNIRYYDETKEAEFTLTERNMDWTSPGTGLYEGVVEEEYAGEEIIKIRKATWQSSSPGSQGGKTLDFPSVPVLSRNHTLRGKSGGILSPILLGTASLSNVHLGADSVANDSLIDTLYLSLEINKRSYTNYLGLFCEVEGTIENVTLQDPLLELTGEKVAGKNESEPVENFEHLYGVGVLCGRSQGKLNQISLKVTKKEAQTQPKVLEVRLADREKNGSERDMNPAGIGGLVGVLAGKEMDGKLKMLTATDATLIQTRNLTVEGAVEAKLPDPVKIQNSANVEEQASDYAYGIGGVFGYAWIGEQVKLDTCVNHANVTGNLFTGGVGGNVKSDYNLNTNPGDSSHTSGLKDCSNNGLVLCAISAARKEEDGELTGRYFGGILGYGSQVEIDTSFSASGRSSSYQYMKDGYDEDERAETLLGQYVGGIIGYGNGCHLRGCRTQSGGYILGSDYVGGIAGGLSNDIEQVITGANEENITVTTNAGYVIGNNYVGGIVGKNDGNASTTIHNCVNNGVAAGYGRYIGGIVGYNGRMGKLENCASYLSDYDHSIYNTIVQNWQTTGDCAGGLAGYNNGEIYFSGEDSATAVKSVSSIVTGRNFVGGVIGFNDTYGKVEADYQLIGGQIHATGAAVGGAIGLNASGEILEMELSVRPVSVTGEYCVGGIIGANVVALEKDNSLERFWADNGLGSITGTAFTGGVIGYHRTYEEKQLGGTDLLTCLLAEADAKTPSEKALLPRLDENNLPTKVMESENPYTLTIANIRNDKDNLDSANNNIPIRGYAYIGGIVGYCERGTSLVIQNCKNSAEISRSGSAPREGVSLKAYLENEGVYSAAQQIEEETRVYFIGGIIGANMEHQVIDHCANTGNMRGFQGLGGIVGFNAGGVFNCELASNFGNVELDYLGGIAGLNVNVNAGTGNENQRYHYTDVKGNSIWNYVSGTIGTCTTSQGRTISGRNYVGGIVGFNLLQGALIDNTSSASVTAAGNYAGGMAGGNAGQIQATGENDTVTRTVTGTSGNDGENTGNGIGGLVGLNQNSGTISVKAQSGTAGEVVAVGAGVTVTGRRQVGGIVGINEGILIAESDLGKEIYLTAQAKEVRALSGYAGGIAGEARGAGGSITQARNRCARVTANKGLAGGIVAANGEGMALTGCENLGNVNSDAGYAGGITAENQGRIDNCTVGDRNGKISVTINSHGENEIGGICAVNRGDILIALSPIQGKVKLTGSAQKAGGVAGVNEGTIQGKKDSLVEQMPEISLSTGKLSVGGIAGVNAETGAIMSITASGLTFKNFRNYQYLGGIVGENLAADPEKGVKECHFLNGTIDEGSSAVGNCYGGIAGCNIGSLSGCTVKGLDLKATGVYTATNTSTWKEKEKSATHIGGIVGKNEESAVISGCFIDKSDRSSAIRVANGMVGGIAGYNKGSITLSGDSGTAELMKGIGDFTEDDFNENVNKLIDNTKGLSADENYVNWGWNNVNNSLEDFSYNRGGKVNQNRNLTLTMLTNGNLGGIAAYNAPSGQVDRCATGNWYLNNKSSAIGVGTGGIIGMNESENDLSFLVNQAFVGKEQSPTRNQQGNWVGESDRFAGGIIGNQNNTTAGGWKLQGCINYGTVYCMWAHYAGGILGQWTGTGGTIEKCYNYGNLQTTYGAGWVGAAGGIVAQLYHAYENNEYNIISCGNYGNIFGRSGQNNGNCANDSAGILGNVTAYRVEDNDSGQRYTIQVLDCVNGSGVEIHSASMASGIVGFFSCDNPDQKPIERSTKNISLRIERCRNFASNLNGANFVGGIFGERYEETGAKNTVLRDCYSVSYNNNNYKDHPIISYENGNNTKNSQHLVAENNYFIDGDRVTFSNGTVSTLTEKLARAKTARAYIIRKDGTDYLAYLKEGTRINNIAGLRAENDKLLSGTTEVGQLLFEISDLQHNNMGNQIANKGSDFDDHVRSAYHKLENKANLVTSETKKEEIEKPSSVEVSSNGNRVTVKVTPVYGTDPFKYKGVLYLAEGENGENRTALRNIEFYSEEYSFELSPEEAAQLKDKHLSVGVKACSMFDEVKDSEMIYSDTQKIAKILPAPSIKVELVRSHGGLTYRFWLENEEDYSYEDFEENWKIQINGEKVEIEPQWDEAQEKWVKTSLYTDSGNLSSDSLQQLLVQAIGTGDTQQVMILPSEQVSVPVFLPAYTPSLALKGNAPLAEPKYSISGTYLSDLSITVTLDAKNSGTITTTPIYRAELIGTWDDREGTRQEDVVIQQTDILTSANGTISAVFSSLPEYMSCLKEDGFPYVTDLRVRVWYAQSGLGEVYTYYSTEGDYAGIYTLKNNRGNICVLDGVEKETGADGTEKVTPVWSYMDSPVLDEATFENYRAFLPESGVLLTWIKAPKLSEKAELAMDSGPDKDRMQYTFRWDEADGAANSYIVSLTGINEDGKEVSIVTNQEIYGNQLPVDAEDWTYENVKLTVTRRGDEAKGEIGLTASKIYPVKQRLPRPAQPTITNPNPDELNYTVEWEPISPEDGCVSYGVFVQPYKTDGTLDTAPADPLATVLVTEKKENGRYSVSLPLEKYAGQKILIYLVALADENVPDSKYVNSVDGVTYELQVPNRIEDPTVTWSKNWEYASDAPVSIAKFQGEDVDQEGGLSVTVRPDKAPPGDSSFLIKAYVFDSEEDAKDAKNSTANLDDLNELKKLEGFLAVYPIQTGDLLRPISMTSVNSTEYLHTLRSLSAEYAGKWVLFYTRISSGDGQISSRWVVNTDIWRLPYVRLSKPQLASGIRELPVTAIKRPNPDLPDDIVTETWTAAHGMIEWSSVELADSYYITLTPKAGTDPDALKEQKFRVVETDTDDGGKKAEVWMAGENEKNEKIWISVPETEENVFELIDYSMKVSGIQAGSGSATPYEVETNARLQAVWDEEHHCFHYTLLLPDADSLKTEEGAVVTMQELKPTGSVTVVADVQENDPEDPTKQSDAYICSEDSVADF